MAKSITLTFLLAVSVAGFTGCKKTPQDNAAERDAKFRADQKVRALKTYQELVAKYPDSEHAAKAKERIKALATPAPAKK